MQTNDPRNDQINELVKKINKQLGSDTVAADDVFEIEEIDEAHGGMLQADPSAF